MHRSSTVVVRAVCECCRTCSFIFVTPTSTRSDASPSSSVIARSSSPSHFAALKPAASNLFALTQATTWSTLEEGWV